MLLLGCCGTLQSPSTSGAARQRSHRAAARANRLSTLHSKHSLSTAERKELTGLTAVDTYDEHGFSPEHAAFKNSHNAMLVDLATYCGGLDGNVFYLDGPGGRTTDTLVSAGFARSQLFTANWHPGTCAVLQSSPHSLHADNVALALADEALLSAFQHVPFAALYLDGCGGTTAPLIRCVDAYLTVRSRLPSRVAVGFTLTERSHRGARWPTERPT